MQQPIRKLGYFNQTLSIRTEEFPIFYVECISEHHLVIAGGGGKAGSGVTNQILIVELIPSNGSFATVVGKYLDIPDSIMSASLMKNLPIARTCLITGGCHPAIYQFRFEPASECFSVKQHKTLDTKIKCVKHTPGMIFAGTTDGWLTLWDDQRVEFIRKVRAHSTVIDEIDVDTVNGHVVTLSRDEGRLVIWDITNFESIREFKNQDFDKMVPYVLRSCRYATIEHATKRKVSSLLVICNAKLPVGQVQTKPGGQPSQLCKISNHSKQLSVTTSELLYKIVNIATAMTIRSDGKYVAIGTKSGDVAVYDVQNLSEIYYIGDAHRASVTDLEFLPPTRDSLIITNSKICPLLSVSFDRQMILHRPVGQSLPTRLLKHIMLWLVIHLLFYLIKKY